MLQPQASARGWDTPLYPLSPCSGRHVIVPNDAAPLGLK